MSAKDKFHGVLRTALEKDGWNYCPHCFRPSQRNDRRMDSVNDKAAIVEAVLRDYEEYFRGSNDPVKTKLFIDREQQYFQLLYYGWANRDEFVHAPLFSIEIIDGKVWVWENRTDLDPSKEFFKRGLTHSDIVLGFIPPEERQYTDYAVA